MLTPNASNGCCAAGIGMGGAKANHDRIRHVVGRWGDRVPGGTIGDEAVIGAGAVVTRDVPTRVFAAGNPCRLLRDLC